MIFIKLIKVYADLDTKNKYYKIVILSNIRMTTYMIKNDNIFAINYFLVKKGLALYEISYVSRQFHNFRNNLFYFSI